MRVAAIDCGTNSIRLLIAEEDQTGLVDVDRRMEVVRLGEGVDRSGRLGDAALARTFAACQRYADTISGHGVEAVRFVATSASRDAANADEFAAGVQEILGVRPEVVTGLVEADLSFVGASRSLPDLPAPALVVDIGGGSTEFVLGRKHAQQAVSVDIGCVRLTERHLRTDPPGGAELAAVRHDADELIARAGQQVDFGAAACLVGLAGTVTTMSAIAHGLDHYDSDRIHGSTMSAAAVHEVAERLAGMSRRERAALAVMHPGRADVIPAGALILSRIVHAAGAQEVVVSEHDILDGIAWSLLDDRG
jgi:exopolyphosphatase/guanosine-5'-triphosphate,3'-diphosphate pyrophosphatase